MKHARLTTLVALVAWVGVLLQLALSLQLAMANGKSVGDGLVIYLGFFTVLTNLLVAISLSWPLLRPHSAPGRWLQRPGVNSAITVSIAIVGLAYHLRHIWNPQGLQWLADVTLHYAVPLLCLVHWWFAVPPARMAWSAPLAWAAWPLAYLAYALLRGVWLQSYPYPFIDVLALGYPQTLLNSAGLLVVFLLLGSVLVAISRARFRPPPL